jgi:hypothetical protein
MNTDSSGENTRAPEIFAAVFSKKKAVSLKRLALLRSIHKCSSGKLGFRDILKEIQRICEGDYSSQQLAYDLRVLRKSKLIDQVEGGEYTITNYGYYLLEVYDNIAYKLGEAKEQGKPAIAGQAIGIIKTKNFDKNKLGEELSKLPVFRKKLSFESNKYYLEWKDNSDDFRSEVEISSDGTFAIRVWFFIIPMKGKAGFIEGISGKDEFYDMGRGVMFTIAYYISRVTNNLWNSAKFTFLQRPDVYPINIFGGDSIGQT